MHTKDTGIHAQKPCLVLGDEAEESAPVAVALPKVATVQTAGPLFESQHWACKTWLLRDVLYQR